MTPEVCSCRRIYSPFAESNELRVRHFSLLRVVACRVPPEVVVPDTRVAAPHKVLKRQTYEWLSI